MPRLVGINEASTFPGFCQRHDTLTFAPLECQALVPTREQAFLLTYRPLLREAYLKQRQWESLQLLRESDKGTPLANQIRLQRQLRLMAAGVEKALSDIRRHRKCFDADLLTKDYSNVRYVAIDLDREPEIVCSGLFQPTVSFSGRRLQDLDNLSAAFDFACFSLLAATGRGVAVFSWRSDSEKSTGALIDSLLALPSTDIPNALVRFAFSTLENTFWRPEWWEGLSSDLKESAIKRLIGESGQPAGCRLVIFPMTAADS